MMRLKIDRTAQKEFNKLDGAIRDRFKRKLRKLLDGSEKPSRNDALAGFPSGYFKIKLRNAGYRLVYYYDEGELVILVIAIGKRDRNSVYEAARQRLLRR
jgi:mRNA interferase RelE/StbE